jgi:glycosyltransferase involved in cell wall biosynthesis
MTRTRVLHVIQNLNYGGMERVLSDIALFCDRERFETHVLCLRYLGRFAEDLGEAATLHLASPMSRFSMLWPRTLATQIRSIAPHVVHSHSGVWYKATFAARLAGVPRVMHTEHGRAKPDALTSRLVDGVGARRSDIVVAVSAELADQLARDLRVPKRKLVVIRNGVDTKRYTPRPDTGRLRAELGLNQQTPIIGSIGRLEPIKGYDVMIDAFAALRAAGADRKAVLVVGGEGSERTALEAKLRNHGLERSVFLLGWRDDVFDLHSAFTIFTMSSRSEGTSISLLEAMSSGLAPVVTDVGGNAAVLGEKLSRRLVPGEEPEALAAGWAEMLANGDQLAHDRVLARQRVLDAFGLEVMVRAYENLYLGNSADSVSRRGEVDVDRPGERGVRGVPPSPRSSAEWPPTM